MAHPVGHNDSQTGAMGGVHADGAHVALQQVALPALLAANADEVVLRRLAAPHDLCPVVIVGGIGLDELHVLHHGLHHALCHTVAKLHKGRVGEIALHGMGNGVKGAGQGMIHGNRNGELGVHHRKHRTRQIGITAALESLGDTGDHRAVARLATGAGNGEHCAHLQAGDRIGLAQVEIHEVAVVDHAVADGLGRVNDAAAADAQDKRNVILPADVNAFIDQVVSGVGFDAAQLPPGYARLFQGGSHGGEEAGFLDAIRAIDNQRLVGILGGLFADLFFHTAAEENFGGAVKFIICHCKSLLI